MSLQGRPCLRKALHVQVLASLDAIQRELENPVYRSSGSKQASEMTGLMRIPHFEYASDADT